MKFYIYRLEFKTPVHFGNGRLSGSDEALYADTFFSALCHEALFQKGEQGIKELYDLVEAGNLRFSDLMPYKKDKKTNETVYYIPKPRIVVESEKSGDSGLKKRFKKLKYISYADLKDYVSGRYIPGDELEFGIHDIRGHAKINVGEDAEPYDVGDFTFTDTEEELAGLYFITGMTDDGILELLDKLTDSLSRTGIGGELSSGLGKFRAERQEAGVISKDIEEHLTGKFDDYISLSISMGKDEELDKALKGAGYELIKRSGFISEGRDSAEAIKKKEMYCFKAGACFKEKFEGKIFDVSPEGIHPVYRYAHPFWFGI